MPYYSARTKPFPIMRSYRDRDRDLSKSEFYSIPWWMAEKIFAAYHAAGGEARAVEHVSYRGGWNVEEMVLYVPDWREQDRASATI